MIIDLAELRRHGRVRRRVDSLSVSVDSWRDGVRRYARREGIRVRTGLVELLELSDPGERRVKTVTVVYAVRIDGAGIDSAAVPRRPSRWEQPPAW